MDKPGYELSETEIWVRAQHVTEDDVDVLDAETTLAVMADPTLWARRPQLALSNVKEKHPSDPEFNLLGYMLEREPTVVYVGLIFDSPSLCERRDYPSQAAMVEAGWRVDN